MESDELFDCTVKRRQLMGQTVYISLMLDIEVSAFIMSNTFQRTFQHLVDAKTVLQSGNPPFPPLQRAPTQALPSLPAPTLPPPSTTDQK